MDSTLKNRLHLAAVAFCLFATLATITGCGEKEAATEGAAAGTAAKPGDAPTLSPEAQSAMQAQQKAEAAARGAQAPPPPK